MPWSFNATGTKEACIAAIKATTPPDDPDNAAQWQRMMRLLEAELEQYGDGSTHMNVAVSGHVPGPGYSDRSLSIWISGRAAQRVESAKPATPAETPTPVDEAPVPPLTPRRGR